MTHFVRKAVFPVAGLGTRFLPATKAVPKEMLPIVDRPLIQYAVDEAIEAGIEQLIFVTGRGKAAIEDYFDTAYELETVMAARGKDLTALAPTRFPPGTISFVRQQEPLGLGHAIWCARDLIGDEPFAVILPDELMIGTPGCLSQMVDAHARIGGNLVATIEVPRDEVHAYGVIAPGQERDGLVEVTGLVEKPAADVAPSNLIIAGRYMLQPEILEILARQQRGAGGEIQLTDAMAAAIGGARFSAMRFAGRRFDCGSKAGYLEATLALALDRRDLVQHVTALVLDTARRLGATGEGGQDLHPASFDRGARHMPASFPQ